MEQEELGATAGSTSAESEKELKPVRITYHLIAKRNLLSGGQMQNQEEILAALDKVNHLRLDRENIKFIECFELLGSRLTNIYLQHNVIEKIENFDAVKNLQFLVLAHNRIKTVENLAHLTKLYFLDLSYNLIEEYDIDEFPQSLIMLDLQGNPCINARLYRGRVLQKLANLTLLDGDKVMAQEKLEVGVAPDSPERTEEEATDPGSASGWEEPLAVRTPDVPPELFLEDRGRIQSFVFSKDSVLPDLEMPSLSKIQEDMKKRSEQRRQEMDMMHEKRFQDLRALMNALWPSG